MIELRASAAVDPGVAELALHAHDLPPVALELKQVRPGAAQFLPRKQKPSEEILEGFDGERLSPARGGCGLRRG
ncbi:MAG: hypothetical protein ACRDOS_00435 [Gaiellaceae bacterium]